MGDRLKMMTQAISIIDRLIGTVERQSVFYETMPWGFESPNRFLNACVRCTTTLTPEQLLATTQQIERQLGRTHKSKDGHYSDRVIDIDLLLYDQQHIHLDNLQIPHPLMLLRSFVMTPLREIVDDDPATILMLERMATEESK